MIGCLISTDSRKGFVTEFFNVGAESSYTSIRSERGYGGGLGKVGLEGPKAGVFAGAKAGNKGLNVGAMAEASIAKASGTLGPFYGSLGLNANTGVKLGTEGVQVSFQRSCSELYFFVRC